MSAIRRVERVPDELPPIDDETRSTFQASGCWPGLVTRGTVLYRYGSTPRQAGGSPRPWVNFSEDRFMTSEEVIQNLCLLDVTVADLGERHPVTGAVIPGELAVPEIPGTPRPWNVAAFQGVFEVTTDFPVWVGRAGPMAFDVFTGKRYRGPGDQYPHITRPGGGSQVLVAQTHMTRLSLTQTVPLARTRYLH